MATRTFGWVQNPGDLTKLKKVAGVFLQGSPQNEWLRRDRLPLLLDIKCISGDDYTLFQDELSKSNICINYNTLKGKGSGSGPRSAALCTGIIQAVIDAQKTCSYVTATGKTLEIKKPYTDDWSADGYLRWAISCGLIEYVKSEDKCRITDLGKKLALSADGTTDEKDALAEALLSYPPVIRVLTLLSERDHQTKFDLGNRLGFKGELGFTSIPIGMYLCDYCSAPSDKERTKVKSNFEGDSDKYARGIASWCSKMGWVQTGNMDVSGTYHGKTYTAPLQTFTITREGEKALQRSRGYSSRPRLPRTVMFEMLASNKAPGSDYLRYQRAAILKTLSTSDKSLPQIESALKRFDLDDIDSSAIADHIDGLRSIGIEIAYQGGKYHLSDKIARLELPPRSTCVKDEVNVIKDRIRSKLSSLDHKYLVLVDLAYSDAATTAKKNADALEFEIQTAELFTKELAFDGMHLGGANKPDVIISHDTKGTIIDNKSYKDGLNIGAHVRDEMSRYVNENIMRSATLNPNEWWLNFDPKVTDYTFLFVTSFLKGNYSSQLDYISASNSGTPGAAINVENLLYFSDGMKNGKYSYDDFYDAFGNKEMVFGS